MTTGAPTGERVFYEYETLNALVQGALDRHTDRADASEFSAGLPEYGLDAANDVLLALLRDPRLCQDVTLDEVTVTPAHRGYGMRLRQQLRDGRPVKMTFIRVKSTWPTAVINLVGLAVALELNPVTAIVPGLNVVKALWENLVMLERPVYALGLDAFDALLAVQKVQSLRPYWPKVSEMAEVSGMSIGDLHAGVRQLLDKGVVVVKLWGGAAGDYNHKDNRWSAAL